MNLTDEKLQSLAALGGDISALVEEVNRIRAGAVKPTIPPASPLRVGNNVFIRTVTMSYTGRVESINEKEIVLSTAAWIADSGRFYDALKSGKLSEVEPFPAPISVGLGALVDVTDWTHPLPTVQK